MGASAAVDPRLACPACGGQVHPIAGRCKHCKADLTRLRAGHPPFAAPQVARPALVALGGGHDGVSHGHTVKSPLPLGSPPPQAVHVASAAPVDDGAPSKWSTRWPLLVAALAIIAILASVAMLIFGGDDDKKTSRAKRFNGPAPELTPTDPGAHQVAPQGAPQAHPMTPTVPDPDPAPPPSLPPPPPPSAAAGSPRDVEDFMRQSVDTLCKRVATCSGFDSSVTTMCSMAPSLIPQMVDSMKSMCGDFDATAARDCVDSLSRFPCPSGGTTDATQMSQTLMGLAGCQRVCAQAFQGYSNDLLEDPDDDPDDP